MKRERIGKKGPKIFRRISGWVLWFSLLCIDAASCIHKKITFQNEKEKREKERGRGASHLVHCSQMGNFVLKHIDFMHTTIFM